ncbi:integral membrane protein [Streptomyces sviceus ATCC 29083]|uniref:Integral membrane protein n=2 Tax=Streptomyces TaxID=1883 RepID=B5HWU8_STRX2|nr:integral membrane protein [Streptomyces sviceus ATCC 29083]
MSMTDGTQSSGDGRDPWAPPESGPSLEKSPSPGAGQPPSVHDQATVTSVPNDGFPPPGAAPGYGYPAPEQSGIPGGPASVPPPPIGPEGPGAPVGYGYPAYPQSPQGYGGWAPPVPPQNGMGVAAMVLGILSCALFCMYGILSLVLGVLAIVFGIKGRKRAERGEATNRGQAQAGFIMGIIGTILGVAVVVLLIIGITAAINSEDDSDYYDGSLAVVATAPSVA